MTTTARDPYTKRSGAFDLRAALPEAWRLLWADNLEKAKDPGYNPNRWTFLTATDLEDQVRRFAAEALRGEPRGSSGRAWGSDMSGVRIKTGRPGGLFAACRGWLLDEVGAGRLEVETLGRGHVSGARFRPRGAGRTAVEARTVAEHARRRARGVVRHWTVDGTWRGRLLCQEGRRTGRGFRSVRGLRGRFTTEEREQVTCANGLRRLAAKEAT